MSGPENFNNVRFPAVLLVFESFATAVELILIAAVSAIFCETCNLLYGAVIPMPTLPLAPKIVNLFTAL
ncbi:MAG: hypothetical protein AAB700_01280, partial [Patescibacteria group bacterium]